MSNVTCASCRKNDPLHARFMLYKEELERPEPPHNIISRWRVDSPNGELYGYSSTWFGAWRLVCQAVGWKVPR